MRKIIGSLLKHSRRRQGKTLEEVCEGICVLSYLSKIENGKVEANDQIIGDLCNRLGIPYYSDPAKIKENEQLLKRYYDNLLYREDTTVIWQDINDRKEFYEYSALNLSYKIASIFQDNGASPKENEKNVHFIMEYIDELDYDDKVFFYLLLASKAKDNEADKLYSTSFSLLNSSFAYFQWMYHYVEQGAYSRVIDMRDMMENLCLEEGNIKALIYGLLLISKCYSGLGQLDMEHRYLMRVKRMLQSCRDPYLQSKTDYNLGMNYLQKGEIELALLRLNSSLERDSLNKIETLFVYHKLCLIYQELDKTEFARKYYDLAMAEMHNFSEARLTLMFRVIEIRFEDNYLINHRYVDTLESLTNLLKHQDFGQYKYNCKLLLEAYKKQRKYKLALDLVQKVKVF